MRKGCFATESLRLDELRRFPAHHRPCPESRQTPDTTPHFTRNAEAGKGKIYAAYPALSTEPAFRTWLPQPFSALTPTGEWMRASLGP